MHSKRARDNRPMLKQGQLTLDIRKHLSTTRTMGVNDIKLLAINIPTAMLLSDGKKQCSTINSLLVVTSPGLFIEN